MFELYQKSHELLSQVLLQTCTSKSSNHLGAVNYIYNNLCYDAKGCCQEAQAAKDEDDKSEPHSHPSAQDPCHLAHPFIPAPAAGHSAEPSFSCGGKLLDHSHYCNTVSIAPCPHP